MYVTAWKVTFQRTRRDRMKLILKFGLERLWVDLQDGTLKDGSAVATARPKVTS
jgi:hypothetical protein